MAEIPQSVLSDPNFLEMAASKNMTPDQYWATLIAPNSPIVDSIEAGPILRSGPQEAPAPPKLIKGLYGGNGSVNYSDLERANGALSATEGDRSVAYQPYDYTMGAIAEPLDQTAPIVTDASQTPVLSEPKEGFHRMPDGSMMADAEMSGGAGQASAPPALEAPAIRNGLTPNPSAMGAADPYAPAFGVLEDTTQPSSVAPVLDTTTTTTNTALPVSSGGSVSVGSQASRPTGNARGSSMPYAKIGMGELMLRAGLKGVGASEKGLSASLGAMGDSYGETRDTNRATAIAEAQAQETTRLAEARMRAAAAGKAKDNAPTVQTAVYQQAALTALDQIQSYLDADGDLNPFDNVTGIIGNVFSSVPGTNAHNVGQAILTVEAAVGFDRLQFMRDNSKTGGALGQVSNIELQLLKSSLGALRQSQTKEAFQTNVNAVRKHYKDAVAKIQQYQAEDQRIANGGAPAAIQQNTTVNKSDLDYING
jgi:hypothetical protein